MIQCTNCYWTVFEPLYCKLCYAPICGPERAMLTKNGHLECTSCSEPFEAADENAAEVIEAKGYLQIARFKCEATSGAKISKCKTEMGYEEFLTHLNKHHKQNQYKCQLDGCKNKKAFFSLDELAVHHWEKDCHHFSDTYQLCKNCKVQKVDNIQHNCITILKSQIEDLTNHYELE